MLSQQLRAEGACQEAAKLRITLRITRGASDLPLSSLKLATPPVPQRLRGTAARGGRALETEVGEERKNEIGQL